MDPVILYYLLLEKNLLLSQPMSSNLCSSRVNYIKSLSISVKIKGYFEEIFDYSSQFSFSPENIRNEGLAAGYSKNLILKGQVLTSSEEKGVKRAL